MGRVLEIGCGSGCFSRMLAGMADEVLALDVAPSAIAMARELGDAGGRVEFRVGNVMELEIVASPPWDLVVMSETLPYLGWLYSAFDVGWLANQIHDSTRVGGRFLMANTCGGVRDYLLRPWLVFTYRDLFRNVGYRVDTEELFTGVKHETHIEALITIFRKEAQEASSDQ